MDQCLGMISRRDPNLVSGLEFKRSQFLHKSVNLSFIITNIKNKLTDLCGNWLLQNDFIIAFCEIKPWPFYRRRQTGQMRMNSRIRWMLRLLTSKSASWYCNKPQLLGYIRDLWRRVWGLDGQMKTGLRTRWMLRRLISKSASWYCGFTINKLTIL